jgi:hypothetical protein
MVGLQRVFHCTRPRQVIQIAEENRCRSRRFAGPPDVCARCAGNQLTRALEAIAGAVEVPQGIQ